MTCIKPFGSLLVSKFDRNESKMCLQRLLGCCLKIQLLKHKYCKVYGTSRGLCTGLVGWGVVGQETGFDGWGVTSPTWPPPTTRPPAWQRASALLARPSNAPPLPESQTTVVLSIAQLLRARPALYNQLLPALYSRG